MTKASSLQIKRIKALNDLLRVGKEKVKSMQEYEERVEGCAIKYLKRTGLSD